jgi:membrane protease YdiL (CAAX protease family)
MNKNVELKGLGLIPSFAIFIPAAVLVFFMTGYVIPYLSKLTGQETVFSWFIVAGLGIFLPLIITAVIILKSEGFTLYKGTWTRRMRFGRITGKDILWSIGGLILVVILSGSVMKGVEFCMGKFDHSPAFMSFEPLSKGRYWLLAVWCPYWILNILGEEILWRGVMLPRQEISFGKYAWIIHGSGWALFHVAFGWQLLITVIPLIYIQSYVVQRTKNSWTGVIMHAGINGPGFLAIAFGLI